MIRLSSLLRSLPSRFFHFSAMTSNFKQVNFFLVLVIVVWFFLFLATTQVSFHLCWNLSSLFLLLIGSLCTFLFRSQPCWAHPALQGTRPYWSSGWGWSCFPSPNIGLFSADIHRSGPLCQCTSVHVPCFLRFHSYLWGLHSYDQVWHFLPSELHNPDSLITGRSSWQSLLSLSLSAEAEPLVGTRLHIFMQR